MAVSTPRIPQCLQIPMITNDRKHVTCFFPFLTETALYSKESSSHTSFLPVLATKLQHMLISQIWQWSEETRGAAPSVSGC